MKKPGIIVLMICISFFLSGYSLAKEYRNEKIPSDKMLLETAGDFRLLYTELPKPNKVIGKYKVSKDNYLVFYESRSSTYKVIFNCRLLKLDNDLWVLSKEHQDLLILE